MYRGGGGGGGGGAGTTATASIMGDGGFAKASDITGSVQWYAGGGGGACVNTTNPNVDKNFGGKGGGSPDGLVRVGGNGAGVDGGATGKELNPLKAQDGVANTGSGGGGGASYNGVTDEVAGNGADGIVVIRLSGFVVKAVPVPSSVNWNFDGNAKTGVVSFFAYTLTGPSVATNADWYHVVAKIDPKYPFQWDDTKGGQGERVYDWKISQMEVAVPAVKPSFVYNGTEQWAVDKMNYSIEKDYCYLTKGGNLHKYCHLKEYRGVNATNYTAVLSLVKEDAQGNFATNYIWSSPYTMADQKRDWEITQAPNAITRFTFDDTQYSNMKHPSESLDATWGENTVIYEYALLGGSETNFVAWGTKGPQLAGNYLVRATLPETPNWAGAAKTLSFGLWMKLGDLYADQIEITVSGCTESKETLVDFPVPVRLHEPKRDGFEELSGFSYARAGATGKEMHFFTSAGVPIEHEVDTWDPYGESLVWVRVPKLLGNAVKLTLCWNRVSDIHIPEYDGGKVWEKYLGVWHMSQVERGRIPDATGNGHDAYFTGSRTYEIEKDQSPVGRSVYLHAGYLLADVNPFPLGSVSNAFSFSGWYEYPDYEPANADVNKSPIQNGSRIFAGFKYNAATLTEMKETPGWCLRAPGNGTNRDGFNWVGTGRSGAQAMDWNYNIGSNIWRIDQEWGYLGFRTGYTAAPAAGKNRGYERFYGINSPTNHTGGNFSFAKSTTDDQRYYVNGNGPDMPLQLAAEGFRVDEVRYSTNVFTEAWMQQEWVSTCTFKNYCTFGLVHRDCDKYNDGKGLTCDWWTAVPGLSKTQWKVGEAGATRSPQGTYKSGATVDYEYFTFPDRSSLGKTQPTAAGFYCIVFDHAASVRGNYWPLSHVVDFFITQPTTPIRDLGGETGRVLLMNADNFPGASVTNQGWCATDPAGVTYWERYDESVCSNNILPGTHRILRRGEDQAKLWDLIDCRSGNTFPTNDTEALDKTQCYLPASGATALSVTNEDQKATRSTTGWLMLRNLESAQAVSQCFTNGVGTVYFDAVNSRPVPTNAENKRRFGLALEIATETEDHLPPTDDNCEPDYRNLLWNAVELCPTHVKLTTLEDLAPTNEFLLVESTAGQVRYFYRFHAPIACGKPVRLRLRRTLVDETNRDPATSSPKEDDSFILVDNVIVSPMTADVTLQPFGRFDENYDGRTAVGYGGAFTTAFPGFADGSSLTGRCAIVLSPDSGLEGKSPDDYLTMKQIFYRWRYLEQEQVPDAAHGLDWNAAPLVAGEGLTLTTEGPLDVPNEPGDVEFYFVGVLDAPYYGYVDYTGLGLAVSKAPYTEEKVLTTARRSAAAKPLPTGGTDWYVRLRDGRSSYEGVRMIVDDGSGHLATNALELTGDQQWTLRQPTPAPVKGGLKYRFEAFNPQVDGATNYVLRTDCWRGKENVTELPKTIDVDDRAAAKDWSTVVCDAATDYLLFQLDERKRRLAFAHCEWQDFNLWSSAMRADGRFVGSTVDTNASNSATLEYNPQWEEWTGTVSTNANWSEDFGVDTEIAEETWYPHNKPFSSALSRNGWRVDNGMWVYGKWNLQKNNDIKKSFGDDSAAQLMGCGLGILSLVGSVPALDGIDDVTFTARLAQYNTFGDFAYYDSFILTRDEFGAITGGMAARSMTDYTFVTMAAMTEKGATSFDGDGTLSLVTYYRPEKGCYELKVARGSNKNDLWIRLYKWYYKDRALTREQLRDYRIDNTAPRMVREVSTSFSGLFISATEYTDAKGNVSTLVSGGFCTSDVELSAGTTSLNGQKFDYITYNDTSATRLTSGSFGVLSCNCPGVFVKPICYLQGFAKYTSTGSHANDAVTFAGETMGESELRNVAANWVASPARMEALTGHNGAWGLQAAPALPQKVVVEVSEVGKNAWTGVCTNEISSYVDREYSDRVRDARTLDVRVKTLGQPDDMRADVVVNKIAVSQWNGQWTPGWDNAAGANPYLSDKFAYTSAWLTGGGGGPATGILLQPTRGKRTTTGLTPVSIRSPLMRGLGLVHFKWKNADPNAVLKVQVNEFATKDINLKNLTATLAEGGESTASQWETVKTLAIGNRESGEETVYINRRYNGFDRGRAYYSGLVRLVIDEEVEEAALSGDRAKTEASFGQVEITEMYTWDLPEYDEHSWVGWNFRATGWDGTRADAFANRTDGMRGLSAILNNTLDADTLADRDKQYYRDRLPSVQSPVFRTNCVAAISFKARLYDQKDLEESGHGAVVTIYGSRKLDAKGEPEPNSWEEAMDVVVSNRTYATYSVKMKANDGYKAIRLAVKGVDGVTGKGTPVYDPPLRVAIDDVCLWERSVATLVFRGSRVRPFRDATAIKGRGAVLDIEDISEQPLSSESFGFQAEVIVQDEEEVVTDDPSRPITVDLWYYAPKPSDPQDWGFDNWKTNPDAVCVRLVPAEGTNFIFRSMVDVSKSLCPPQFLEDGEPYRLVQYHMVASFYHPGDKNPDTHELQRDEWVMPEWYLGFPDPNRDRKFSAFTIIERLAPHRAWINEINFVEGDPLASTLSQWIELAIPSGEDMTGWKVDAYGYNGEHLATLATLGTPAVPSSKVYTGNNEIAAKSHYAFYVMKSPNTVMDEKKYDAVWTDGFNGNGSLEYNRPYAITLTRPTGIIEHRLVVQGKNTAKEEGWIWWGDYEGTNLVDTMERDHGGTWVWTQEDYLEHPGSTVSVVTNQGMEHVEWVSPLKATPSDINLGQYIDPNWLIRPNGGYVWIYSSTFGEHLRQIIGGVTNTAGSLVISEGSSTNILYEADRWYQLGDCTIDPSDRTELTELAAGEDGKRYWKLALNSVSNRIDILAKEGVSETVEAFGATPDNPYTPAIMKWLETGMVGDENGNPRPFRNPNGPLIPMVHRGTTGDHHDELRFPDMYWLDIDPTEGNWELWGGMGQKPGSAEALPVNDLVHRDKTIAGGEVITHTNHVTSCWIELRNTASGVVYPPYRLQGLGNERSDDKDFAGAWTSVNFKVSMTLNNGKVDNVYRPLRYFVFDKNSFYPATDPNRPSSAVIEITDPFSPESLASEWGWQRYESLRENSTFTKFELDGRIKPTSVTTLKKDDRLEF